MPGTAEGAIIDRRHMAISAGAVAVATIGSSSASRAQAPLSEQDENIAFIVPPGAIDCHRHIFDPDRFTFAPVRRYTPGAAIVADQQAFHAKLGTSRVVLVQPSVYGTDNACLIDGLALLGPQAARGVAVIDPATVKDSHLAALKAAGVVASA